MKRVLQVIYTLMLTGVAGNAFARPSMEINSVSLAMITFMVFSLIAFVITWAMWKFNDIKRRKVMTKMVNRGPVKRSPVIYIHKKSSATVEHVNVK